MAHPMLDYIDAALKAVGRAKVFCAANGDVFETVCREPGVTLDPATNRFAHYEGVKIERSMAQIPPPGYVVNIRFV